MFPSVGEMPSTKVIISTAASAAATAMLIRSISREYIPTELRNYIFFKIKTLINSFSNELTFVIEEFDNLNENKLFKAAELYLEPIIPPNALRLKLSLPKKETNLTIAPERNQEIIDVFKGITFKWRFICKDVKMKYIPTSDRYNPMPTSEHRFYELCFHKKHKSLVLEEYIKHVMAKSKEIKQKKKTLKLHTLKYDRVHGGRGGVWQSVNLDHPATFDTLAMDVEVKRTIMEDLERFVKRKEYYKKVGKAWKRGYLLFGPPGTGKSSLIAAMANYLKFDIYDLELTDLRGNSELRKLLISTGNKSILVVEDIDCTIELKERAVQARTMNAPLANPVYPQVNQVTLSGLLNFIDGLWSSCGDERIIVFTTNHREKLDPALLRPGRMDVHIHMSYCTPCGFRMLAFNYLGITEHVHFLEIEELIAVAKVTPAEVAEQLMKTEEPEVALRGLIEFLECKKRESEEKKNNASDESKSLEENKDSASNESKSLGESNSSNGEIENKEDKNKKEVV